VKTDGGVLAWLIGYLPGWDADLHMALLMKLPFTVFCSSKSIMVFTHATLCYTREKPWQSRLSVCLSVSVNITFY